MDFDWYELANNSVKFRYKTDSFSENPMGKRFNRLNHEYMLMSVASYGGPIALTSDKTKILTLREEDQSIKNICLFKNDGEIAHLVELPNPFQNVVVHLEFIQDELLLVVFQQGNLWLVDPNTGRITRSKLKGLIETEQVIEVKVFENGCAFLTNKSRFMFVRSVYQPQCLEFVGCEQELLASKKVFWTVFSPKHIISEKIQLHICHPTAGIVQVIENESKRLFYNRGKNEHIVQSKLPNLKGITYISELSPNKKMVAYFSAEPLYKESPMDQISQQTMKKNKGKNDAPAPKKEIIGYAYRLIFAPSLTSDAIGSESFSIFETPFVKSGVHVDENQSLKDIKWCGNKAVVVQFANMDLYMYSVYGDYVRIEKDRGDKNKWSYLKQEIDGVRIISRQENKIMRQIPASYISIFQAFCEEPGALLYAAYEAFEDEAPLQDDQIRKQKKRLAVGVEQCLKASRFEIKFDIVLKLMRSATYGKAFLPPNMIPNNLVYDTSKILRIVHTLRQKNRYITFEQLESLNNDLLLKILLRYREHYLAFEIYQYLKKDQNFRVKIFTDWACCKVENVDEPEEMICETIREKLLHEKGISFTEIAHKAIEVDRSDLALRLLSFQPSLAKKVPLLLWMGMRQNSQDGCLKFYERALEEALRSRDLNLLFLTIRRIMTSERIPRDRVLSMFSSHREGRAALINYFRLFDSKSLIEYYRFYLNDMEAVIMEYLMKAFAEKSYETCQSLFQCAVELLKEMETYKDDWRKEAIPKLYGHLCQFIKYNPQIRFRNDKVKPVTISTQLTHFLSKKDSTAANDIKNAFKIPDRRVVMAQIKVFIDEGKWEDLETFVERNQKKYNLPVELIADMVFAKREDTWAMRLMARMPSKSKDQQYLLLQRIGKYKEAIDLASDRKDIDALEDIQATLIDANLMAYANEKINLIKRR